MRVVLLAFGALALAAGVAGGLARLGALGVVTTSAAFHGALMVCGFLGTVIGIERAVALAKPAAYLAPAAAALGTLALLAGFPLAAAVFWIAAPLALLAVSLAIVARQLALHTALLALAAAAWAVGSIFNAAGQLAAATAWWFAFLVLTIAAERLEMTRLMKRRRWAAPLFIAITGALLAGAAFTAVDVRLGARVYGLSLVALSAWLAVFDIARRTIRAEGFARYAALALLGGYAWLAVAGAAWAFAPERRDLALHAVGLGFVVSMIFAHAPLIVPVIARVRMRYIAAFYAPLALLHVSLLLRALWGAYLSTWRSAGALLNALAIALFVATLLYAIATRDTRSTSAAMPS